MPFNPQVDAYQVISKNHKVMLKIISKSRGRFMRKIIEEFIENEYKKVTK